LKRDSQPEAHRMTENDVVGAACKYLESDGYEVLERCHTTQRGDDIVAARQGKRLAIEAKGATSASSRSARYGQQFNSTQIKVHVAEAVFRSLQVLSRSPGEITTRAGIALPTTKSHRKQIASIAATQGQLRITLFWVDADGEVERETYEKNK
jgi:Holliday junction resolvase-like predicted endonuclease